MLGRSILKGTVAQNLMSFKADRRYLWRPEAMVSLEGGQGNAKNVLYCFAPAPNESPGVC